MSDKNIREKLPDGYYVDKHESDPDGIDPEDIAYLARMVGTVRGELNQIDRHREGLSSGPPSSKLTADHIKNAVRGGIAPGPTQPDPSPVVTPPVAPSRPVPPPVTAPAPSPAPAVMVESNDILSLKSRLDKLEAQYSRLFKPIHLKSSYNIKSNKISATCDTFEDLFDLLKRYINKNKTITITKVDEDTNNK